MSAPLQIILMLMIGIVLCTGSVAIVHLHHYRVEARAVAAREAATILELEAEAWCDNCEQIYPTVKMDWVESGLYWCDTCRNPEQTLANQPHHPPAEIAPTAECGDASAASNPPVAPKTWNGWQVPELPKRTQQSGRNPFQDPINRPYGVMDDPDYEWRDGQYIRRTIPTWGDDELPALLHPMTVSEAKATLEHIEILKEARLREAMHRRMLEKAKERRAREWEEVARQQNAYFAATMIALGKTPSHMLGKCEPCDSRGRNLPTPRMQLMGQIYNTTELPTNLDWYDVGKMWDVRNGSRWIWAGERWMVVPPYKPAADRLWRSIQMEAGKPRENRW